MEHAHNRRSQSVMFIALLLGSMLLGSMLLISTGQAAEVYRWVDENGEVHYSETLPPHLKGTSHDVLNERGIVTDENQSLAPPPPTPEAAVKEEPPELPRDASGMPRAKAQYTDAQMQQQMDNLLLLRYETEQEISDAMNVEIRQLNYDRRLLETSRKSMDDAYHGQIRIAAEKQRAGIQVEDDAIRNIETLQGNLSENQHELDRLKEREELIRAEFQVQLDRYRFLQENMEEAEG